MKLMILAVVLLALLAAAAVLPRKSVHAELTVDATPAEVWAAVTDTAAYGEWNPIFVTVEGVFAEGALVRIDMRTSDGGTTPIEARVEELIPERKLHQSAGMSGVLSSDHNWLIEDVPGGARVVQHEEYRGIAVLFWDPSYVQVLYQQGLAALKVRLEGDIR